MAFVMLERARLHCSSTRRDRCETSGCSLDKHRHRSARNPKAQLQDAGEAIPCLDCQLASLPAASCLLCTRSLLQSTNHLLRFAGDLFRLSQRESSTATQRTGHLAATNEAILSNHKLTQARTPSSPATSTTLFPLSKPTTLPRTRRRAWLWCLLSVLA